VTLCDTENFMTPTTIETEKDGADSSAPICSPTRSKYQIIYADPPWQYNDTLGGNAKMGAMPYATK
jgi:16S rRNA G966 N2-methylase RsmD